MICTQKIRSLFKLIRFELPFSAGICVFLGQLLAAEQVPTVLPIFSGILSVFCISAGILVLNDIIDIETDKINAPHRPLPSGLVSPYEAFLLTASLFVSGLILSAITGIGTEFCAVILIIMGVAYNMKFKKAGIWGNLLVSLSVAMTFIYGGISIGQPLNKIVLLFAAISGLIDLGEEIAADANDAEGDKLIASQSIALRFGEKAALRVSGIIFLAVILLTLLPVLSSWFPLPYSIILMLMDCSILFCAIKIQMSSQQKRRAYLRLLYLSGTTAVILIVVLKLCAPLIE